VNVSILPRSDNTYDLGSSDYRWKNVHLKSTLTKHIGAGVEEEAIKFVENGIHVFSILYDGTGSSPNNYLKIRDVKGGYGDIFTINQQGNTFIKGYLDISSLKVGGTEIITSGRVLQNIASIAQNLLPNADNSYDLGSSSKKWKNGFFANQIWIKDHVLVDSDYQLRNIILDQRYGYDWLTLINFQPNALYLAHKRGYTASWNDTTGLTGTDSIWYPDLEDHFMTIDLSQSADPLILTVTGSMPITTQVGTIRLIVVWHGGKGYNDIKFEVKRNDDVWVEVPLDFEASIGGSTYQVSKTLNTYAPYPTYTPWKAFRITFSNKVTTSGNRYLYGVIYYAPRGSYPYFIRKRGDTIFGTLTAQQIIPRTDNSYDLGSSSYRWKDLFVKRISAGGLSLDIDESLIMLGSSAGGSEGVELHLRGTTGGGAWILDVDSDNNLRFFDGSQDKGIRLNKSDYSLNVRSILPWSNNTYDLGSSSYRWKNGYFAGALDLGSLKVGGTEVIDSSRVLKNVTASRSILTDLFDSPFWDNIPDKPFSTLGSEFTVSSGELQIASILRSKISDLFNSPFWSNIPDKPFEGLGSEFDVDGSNNLIVSSIDFSKIANRLSSLLTFDSSLIPNADNTYNLGSSSYRWKNIFGYTLNILGPGRTIGANPSNASNGWLVLTNGSRYLGIDDNEIASDHELYIEASQDIRIIAPTLRPNTDNSVDLGSSSYRWKNGYFAGKVGIGVSSINAGALQLPYYPVTSTTTLLIGNNADMGSHNFELGIALPSGASHWPFGIIKDGTALFRIDINGRIANSLSPQSDNTYDLGSSSLRWKDGYFAGNIKTTNISLVNDIIRSGSTSSYLKILLSPYSMNDILLFRFPDIYEYDDGSGWTTGTITDEIKSLFMMKKGSFTIPYGYNGVRFTWNGTIPNWMSYVWMMIKLGTGHHTVDILVEVSTDGTTWETLTSIDSVGTYGSTVVAKLSKYISDTYKYLRITFTPNWNTSYPTQNITLLTIKLFNLYTSNWDADLHTIFDWDADKVISFYNTIKPNADNSYDLGSSSLRWKNGYFAGYLYATRINAIWEDPDNDVSIGADNDEWLHVKNKARDALKGVACGALFVNGAYIDGSSSTIRPRNDNTYDLGSSSYRWKDIYFAGNLEGTNWHIKQILVDTTANRPSAGVQYRLFISTDEQIIYLDDGSQWIPLGAVYK